MVLKHGSADLNAYTVRPKHLLNVVRVARGAITHCVVSDKRTPRDGDGDEIQRDECNSHDDRTLVPIVGLQLVSAIYPCI